MGQNSNTGFSRYLEVECSYDTFHKLKWPYREDAITINLYGEKIFSIPDPKINLANNT